MKVLVCKICGYIAINGKTPEKCPVCCHPKSDFEEKEDVLKKPADAANLTETEKKHAPVIMVIEKCGLIPEGCEDVHVKLGEIKHPMLPEHSIVHIDFYVDGEYMSRVMLTPERMNAAAALHLKVPATGKLSVVAFCNVHGAWIGEATL